MYVVKRKRGLRTSERDGEGETSEPHARILEGREGLAGGKGEVSGNGVGRDGELEKRVSE